jgi:hypothetical protein
MAPRCARKTFAKMEKTLPSTKPWAGANLTVDANWGAFMRRMVFSAVSMLALAAAAVAADPAQTISLTIYNSNLALVQDMRRLDIAAGRQRLEFKNVSARIRPETVALTGKDIGVVEQNFDYDLLTPSKMMEKAVGKQIKIIRTNPATGHETPELATVLSVNDGVVLKIGDRIEVLRDDGIPTRVVFSSIPENLRANPTLSVTVQAREAGPRDVTLSYLTTGMNWKADYVALFDEGRSAMTLQGWITLTNQSGVSYKSAKTQLVAGAMENGSNTYNYGYNRPKNSTRQAGTRPSGDKELADYLIYDLPERLTVAENQTKQVSFLDLQGVKTQKVYEYRAGWFNSDPNPNHADVVLNFVNRDRALPKGTIRVYMRDAAGEAKFLGENAIDHSPGGSEVAVKIGEAFDVTAQGTLMSSELVYHNKKTRYSMSYVFRNAKSAPATVEFRQGGLWRDADIDKESLKSRRIDASTLGWSVPVPANGETVLTFTVTTG